MAIEGLRTTTGRQRTAVAIFQTQPELVRAVRELHRLGYTNDQISILAQDHEAVIETARVEGATDGVTNQAPEVISQDVEPKGRDEAVGMVLGGAVGLVVGLTSIAIPGFGAFLLAAGPAAIALHALTTSAAGIGMGALLGAILDEKVTEEHRDKYASDLRAGYWMMVVHGGDSEVERAAEALQGLAPGRLETF